MKTMKLMLAAALASALIACGGGSGGSNNTASSSNSPPGSSSVQAASSSSAIVSSSPGSIVMSSESSVIGSSASSLESSRSSEASSASSASSDAPASGTLACEAANTVQGFASMDNGTTGGANGTYVVAKTGADIATALASKKDNPNPLIIYINGTITPENSGTVQFDVKDMSNVSIIGVGNAALFDGIGINIVRAQNIIVRNVAMRYVRIGQKDAISIDDTSSNIWIDHNELYNSLAVDKDYYDELVSGKGSIDKVTISYNYLHDSWKTSLWGSSDTNSFDRRVTFYANHWDNVNSRLPLFRFGQAHILNNYYANIAETGINSRMGARMRIEGNHFENAKNPILSKDSIQVGYWDIGDTDTNIYENVTWNPSTCTGETAGTCVVAGPTVATTESYTPPYTYTVMPVANVKNHVVENAGVNKVSRACLGVPDDIVEGETGTGTAPVTGVSVGSGEGEGGDGQSGSAEGGWTVEAMKMGSSTTAISGAVTSSSETGATFTIAGGKFESSKEAFFFINKVVSGDFVFTANLSAWNNPTRATSDQGSVGVMMCAECDTGGSAGASARIGLRDTGILHAQRLSAGGSVGKATIATTLVPSDQLYLRVARTGNAFTVSYSVDAGTNYTLARTNTFTTGLPEDVKLGLYAAQGDTETNGFTFQNITLVTSE